MSTKAQPTGGLPPQTQVNISSWLSVCMRLIAARKNTLKLIEAIKVEHAAVDAEIKRIKEGNYDPDLESREHLTELLREHEVSLSMHSAKLAKLYRSLETAEQDIKQIAAVASAEFQVIARQLREKGHEKFEGALEELYPEEFQRGFFLNQHRDELLKNTRLYRLASAVDAAADYLNGPRTYAWKIETLETNTVNTFRRLLIENGVLADQPEQPA